MSKSEYLPMSDECLRHPAAPVKKSKLPEYLNEPLNNGKRLKPKKPQPRDVEVAKARVPEYMEEGYE